MEANVEEIWKDIPEYEGFYQASSFGRIRSLERWKQNHSKLQLVPECILKQTLHKVGYYMVSFRKFGPQKSHYVHRLILLTFKGPSHLKYCDHINEIKTDNRPENLRYCTNRDNSLFYFGKLNKYVGTVRTKNNTYYAYIMHNGKRYRLGTRKTVEEAAKLYNDALHKINTKGQLQ